MEDKTKHLEFIQGVVNRMAHNSFLLKGWTVALVTGLTALSAAAEQKIWFVLISFIPVFAFWGLDGYFLWQERLFRAVYDHVRQKHDGNIDFAMNPVRFNGGKNTWTSSVFP